MSEGDSEVFSDSEASDSQDEDAEVSIPTGISMFLTSQTKQLSARHTLVLLLRATVLVAAVTRCLIFHLLSSNLDDALHTVGSQQYLP